MIKFFLGALAGIVVFLIICGYVGAYREVMRLTKENEKMKELLLTLRKGEENND